MFGFLKEVVEDQTVLKPSQALRIGISRTSPPRLGTFSHGGACALTAMAVGYGMPFRDSYGSKLREEATAGRVFDHIKGRLGVFTQLRVIWRHDVREHSREKIARWLESKGL